MDGKTALTLMRQWEKNNHPGPEHIVTFLTNKCNLHCRHCWRHWCDWDQTCESELPDERWLRLVDEAAAIGTKRFSFLGGGEPLMRNRLLMEMVRRGFPHGMNFQIHTNGVLFTPPMMDALMENGLTTVNFSIDGPDAETNNQIRGSGFEKAIANLRYFNARKQQLNCQSPDLTIYATITNLTYNKIIDFVELAASIGPDTNISISALVVEHGDTLHLDLTPEQKESFPALLQQGIARANQLGVLTNFQYYLDTEILKDSTAMQRNVLQGNHLGLSGALCYEPWLSATILPDGQLGPCCAFYDPQLSLSIKDLTLEQVWNGNYMRRVRDSMFNGNPPGYCVRCPSNLFMDKEKMRIFLTRQLYRDHESALVRYFNDSKRGISVLLNNGPFTFAHKLKEWIEIQCSKQQ